MPKIRKSRCAVTSSLRTHRDATIGSCEVSADGHGHETNSASNVGVDRRRWLPCAGCQSGPRFAWWKHDKAPDDTSAVARSATTPTLPSAQATPQAVAVAGLTPAAPPSSTQSAPLRTGRDSDFPASGAASPRCRRPRHPSRFQSRHRRPSPNAPLRRLSADERSGRQARSRRRTQVSRCRAFRCRRDAPAAAAARNAFRLPGRMIRSATSPPRRWRRPMRQSEHSAGADRYGLSCCERQVPAATTSSSDSPQPLASDPADRYGSPRRDATAAAATPSCRSAHAIRPAVAADRYSNPTLPSHCRSTST